MWDKTVLAEAIAAHRLAAAEALARVQPGRHPPDTSETYAAAAALLQRPAEEIWVDQLEHLGLLDAFGAALEAQGVGLEPPPRFSDSVDPAKLAVFGSRARAFRCRVRVNDTVAGSGCLIGPSLVLTAWHVVAVGAPGVPQEPAPRIRVVLADGGEQDVAVPPRFTSLCGDAEWTGSAPRADADVEGRNDVAVLVMRRPAAAHLGHAGLPTAAQQTASRSSVLLVHYPEGQDEGIGLGHLSKIRNVTARWRHDIETAAGSSGGPCFDRELEMTGLHQGKWEGGGRLVPIGRFLADLEPLVRDDVAPTTLWSLDGSDGALVIGRDLFFQAVAAAGDDSRVRGLRIKRNDPAGPTTGLAFSADMLLQVLHRRGPEQTVVRVGFDGLVPDLVDDLHDRVVDAGLPLPAITVAAAVAPGAAAPEGAARDRAALLAVAVDAAAAQAGRTVWFFFDNPSVALSEPARLALDGFVAAALRRPRLRLVVAGFETVALPGQEFSAPPAVGVAGPPGLVVEFLGGFRRADVVDVLTRAAQDLLGQPENPAVVDAFAATALTGLASFNGRYAADALPTVAERVRPVLETWRERGR